MHAWHSVSHYDIAKLTLLQGQVLAYRTIEDAVATAAFGLGGQVQMCVATRDGARQVDKAEIDAIVDAIKIVKGKEIEALGALAPSEAPASAGVEAKPPPKENSTCHGGRAMPWAYWRRLTRCGRCQQTDPLTAP
jgi:hypothetical protein